ncbi:ankyrin repeat-containing protein BDA1-like [Corylus avellana]|uniref:ankyrin repeat-containing protein BDA1-like n=1 Tax=Corylus avellana TaxID=13451 RepID=UPI00286B622F|nr:ankyrin repeat-containing protein BDA1-like [Corylus avellana]
MDGSLRDSAEQRNIGKCLRDAAEQGNIDALYVLIEKDAHVLDRVDKIPFVDTPLHIAVSAGHIPFVREIMGLKPSFARKLNQYGLTPLHIALQNHAFNFEKDYILQRKQALLVDRLLDFDKDFVRVRGREGVTPLHYIIQKGDLSFLKKFLEACPESLDDVTIRGENALHIALKYDMIDVFWYLVQWLGRACFKDAKLLQEKLLDGRDDDGNTLLHVAVSRNQPEVVSWLLDHEPLVWRLLDVGSVVHIKNLEGHTVLGILELQSQQTQVDNQRIGKIIRQHCVRRLTTRLEHYLRSFITIFVKFYVGIRRRQTVITEERRNALLVVAGLLTTVTYPAALSADQPNEFNCTSPSPINATGAGHFNCTARFNPDSESRDKFVGAFYGINTAVFYLTNVTLFFLVPPDFIGWLLTVLVGLLFCCYCFSSPLLSNARIIAWFGIFGGYFVFLPLLLWFRMAMSSFKSRSFLKHFSSGSKKDLS